MTLQIPSLSLKKITEITHIAPLKQGFVKSDLAMTYATRLRAFLRLLFALRQKDVSGFKSPVDQLGLIHFARWQLIDKDTRLLFTTNFDGSWENYIHAFVDTFPRLLDLIWSHCKGYPREAAKSYRDFSDWVERYQAPTQTLYASHADVTVLDIEYLKELKERYDRFSMSVQELGETASAPELLDQIRSFQKDVYEINPAARPKKIEPMPLAGRVALEELRDFFQGDDRALFDAAVSELDPEGRHDPERVRQVSVSVDGPSRKLASDNIQSGILEDYDTAIWGRVSLIQLDDDNAWSSFLEKARESMTTAAEQKTTPYGVNVALTFEGLRRLGLSEDELETFPIEFQLGMEGRAEVLRDVGMNDPRRWPHEVDTSRVDAVVIGFASKEGKRECEKTVESLVAGARSVHDEALQWPNGNKIEPFGFRDGLSQPVLREKGATGAGYENVSAYGEFLLGHANDRGEVEFRPKSPELRNDSTYLVMRKLAQDVEGFESLVGVNSEPSGPSKDDVKAALMGRRPDGGAFDSSIASENYDAGPHASGCPFHSHVRGANPRERQQTSFGHASLPRILRRGMPYGKEGAEGLMFMALNASIASQYEVIQQWLNGANVTPGMSTDPDPIVGVADLDVDAMKPTFTFLHDGRVRYLKGTDPHEPLVRLLWGLYCFVPSKAALEYLIENRGKPSSGDSRYLDIIRALDKPGLELVQRNLVKRLLEEPGTSSVTAPRLWAEVRKEKDPVDTAYGTLVAKRDDVAMVLSDGTKFSVDDGYQQRMKLTTGKFYLGVDDEKEHERKSEAANKYVYEILARPAMRATAQIAENVLSALIAKSKASALAESDRRVKEDLADSPPPPGISISFQLYGAATLLHISQLAFGVPVKDKLAPGEKTALADVRPVSAYIFYPNPEAFGRELALDYGAKIKAEVRAAVRAASPDKDGNLIEHLLAVEAQSTDSGDRDPIEVVTGLACGIFSGFFVPTLASFQSVMREWHQSGELERVRSWYDARHPEKLDEAIYRALRLMPMPSLMHRMAIANADLPSGGRIYEGRRVIAGLVPDEHGDVGDDLLFGAGMHRCPGRGMAVQVLRDLVAALLVHPGIHRGANGRQMVYLETQDGESASPDKSS